MRRLSQAFGRRASKVPKDEDGKLEFRIKFGNISMCKNSWRKVK
jgi:hypothetical protein